MSAGAAPYVSVTYKTPDQQHSMKHGTSMATAHTTGSIALLMQQSPNLSPNAIRLELHRRVRLGDPYMVGAPNSRIGWGKLDLKPTGGSVAVGDFDVTRLDFAPPWPSPSQGAVFFRFEVTAEDLAAADGVVKLSIYDVAGRAVATVHGSPTLGSQQLMWDGRTDRGVPSQAGVYFARLSIGDATAVRKFMRLDP